MGQYEYIAHHGVKGQKWGVRNYQNLDGSLTLKGRKRYSGMNYTTSEEPQIHKIKVKGAGKKYGKYRVANKEYQEGSSNPVYGYGTPSAGVIYSYSGESTGNVSADIAGAMIYSNIREYEMKKNRKTQLINKAKAFIKSIPKKMGSAAGGAISAGVAFVQSLMRR